MNSVASFFSLKEYTKNYYRKIRRNISKDKEHINSKVDIINWLGEQYGYTSYLQISTYTTGGFYDKISSNLYSVKECLNYFPDNGLFNDVNEASVTKDHFVKMKTYECALETVKKKHQAFDVIFVDSFHTFDQTNKDLLVALSLLKDNGVIIVHDCYPKQKKFIGNTWQTGTWLGQTYESFINFRVQYPAFETAVVNIDYGCGIIRPSRDAFNPIQLPQLENTDRFADWSYFSKHAHELLNLISVKQFKEYYSKID